MKMLPLLLLLLLPPLQAPAQGDVSDKPPVKLSDKPAGKSRGKPLQEAAVASQLKKEQMTTAEFLTALKALRKAEAPERIESFKLEAIFAAMTKGKVDVNAEILYREPYYMRTTIREGKKTIQRGLEGYHAWMSQNGESYKLQGRAYAEDRQAVRRDAALARLTARFLYPDLVLKGLVDLEGPKRAWFEEYENRKRTKVDYWQMRGKAAKPKDYPLVLSPDHEGDIEITAFFDALTLLPRRVYLRPLDAKGKPIPMRTEAIFFSNFKERSGLQIPLRLGFFQPDPKRKVEILKKVSKLKIQGITLPKEPLGKSLFRMPK